MLGGDHDTDSPPEPRKGTDPEDVLMEEVQSPPLPKLGTRGFGQSVALCDSSPGNTEASTPPATLVYGAFALQGQSWMAVTEPLQLTGSEIHTIGSSQPKAGSPQVFLTELRLDTKGVSARQRVGLCLWAPPTRVQ